MSLCDMDEVGLRRFAESIRAVRNRYRTMHGTASACERLYEVAEKLDRKADRIEKAKGAGNPAPCLAPGLPGRRPPWHSGGWGGN